MLEDLGVGAVVHELLHGLLHGFGGLGIALLDGDGVRHFIEVLAELFQLTIGLGDGVADNRGIGEEDVGLAGHHSGGGVGLLLGGLDGDVFLAVRLALLGGLVDGLFLDGAGLDGNVQTAQVVLVDVLGVACGHCIAHACGEVGDEVDGFHALLGDGEGGDAQIVLGADGRNDRIEVGGDDFGLETEDVAHGAGEIHVVADLGLAVGVEEFGRGVGGVGADGELAVLGHGFRQQCGDGVILLHGADIVAGDGGGIGALGGIRTGIGLVGGAASGGGEQHGRAQCNGHNGLQFGGLHNRFFFSLTPLQRQRSTVKHIYTLQCIHIQKDSRRRATGVFIVTETTRRTG